MRLGLAANRLHHLREDAALFRWLQACEPGIRELGLELHTVGRTFDAIASAGLLPGYTGLRRYPYGRDGGLMKLVAEVVGLGSPERTLDGARCGRANPPRRRRRPAAGPQAGHRRRRPRGSARR